MGLPIGDIKLSANFELNIAKPIDSRYVVDNAGERDNISFKYEGMIVWVKSDSKHYKLLSDLTTWVDLLSGTSPTLSSLNDVNILTPTNNDFLIYDEASASWINKFVGLQDNPANKMVNPLPTNGNISNTGVALVNAPLGDIIVVVNGIVVEVTFGSTSGKCYFANPMNINIAKNYKEVEANDVLIWNGLNIGYDLDNTDEISIYYEN